MPPTRRNPDGDKDGKELADGWIVKKISGLTGPMNAQARRTFIAEACLVFGLTQVEIKEALDEAGLVNPKTGGPWSLGTVNRDIRIMREAWAADAKADYSAHVESQLARIKNAQRAAWSRGNLDAYARFMEQEIKITGTGQHDLSNIHEEDVGDGWDLMEVLDVTVTRIEERNRLLGEGPVIDGEVS